MAGNTDVKPHIFLGANGKAERYTAPSRGGGSKKQIPDQDRLQHGTQLKSQLEQVHESQQELNSASVSYELESGLGIQVAFTSFPDVEMAVESLADARQGIELLNVRHSENQVFATIFVPEGKLTVIEKKLQDYLDSKKNKKGNPIDNRPLIDTIQSFRVAALESLWTDDDDQLPASYDEKFWWEVWLPVLGDRPAVIHDFKLLAGIADIQVSQQVLEFPERSVLLAKGTRNQFSSSSLLLNKISELRRAKETAAFFDSLSPEEQTE